MKGIWWLENKKRGYPTAGYPSRKYTTLNMRKRRSSQNSLRVPRGLTTAVQNPGKRGRWQLPISKTELDGALATPDFHTNPIYSYLSMSPLLFENLTWQSKICHVHRKTVGNHPFLVGYQYLTSRNHLNVWQVGVAAGLRYPQGLTLIDGQSPNLADDQWWSTNNLPDYGW